MKLKPATERKLIDCLFISLAIFIPYHQVAQHTFTEFDDNTYIFRNNHVIAGLSWDSLVWAFTTTETGNWHPLTWISHLIDRELFGAHPGGYLLMNVAWHTIAACLCYSVFNKCTKSRLFALTVALIFALHPVNVENVAWASERKSLLNALFWFAALHSYLKFIESGSLKSYGCTVIFFLLSLFSKAMSVTLPCTLGLIHCLYLVYHRDHLSWPERLRRDWKQILRRTLPLLVISVGFSAVTMSVQSSAMPGNYPLPSRLINVLLSYERYLVMFFHPTELAIYYPLDFDKQSVLGSAFPSLLILVFISSVVLLMTRARPQLIIGWCWFLGTMIPTIGLVQVGLQSHADRYLYIPMLGLAFLFPVLFEMLGQLGDRLKKAVIGMSLGVLSVTMLLATQIQVSFWKDGVTLSRHSLDVTGFCFHAWISLDRAYTRAGRFDEYFAFLDFTLAIEKNSVVKALLATMKANALHTLGRHRLALDSAQNAIDWGYPTQASYILLAASSYELGKIDKAAHYLAAAKANPEMDSGDIMLAFPLKAKMTWLELKLKEQTALRGDSR